MRQAFAGMLWSKQLYYYDVARWLDGDPTQPTPPASRLIGRNSRWRNFDAFDIMSMPDKWEYPWFAAWDLAFHCVTLAHVDPAFAKYQLVLVCREWFQAPNGALPAYEWDFGDVNPPVQAWAALEVFAIDGGQDLDFLSRIFDKLLVNFTWWVNREDASGANLFEGGFLGLDNIGPLDRSHLPVGGTLQQSDATGWMAFYALDDGHHRRAPDTATGRRPDDRPGPQVPRALRRHHARPWRRKACGTRWMAWLRPARDARAATVVPVKVRSMVGIIPALAAIVIDEHMLLRSQLMGKQFAGFLHAHRLARPGALAWPRRPARRSPNRELLLACLPSSALKRLLTQTLRRVGVSFAIRPARDLGLPPRSPVHARGRGHPRHDRLRAGRVHHGDVRRQLELARADLVPAQLPAGQRARALPPLPRRRVHDRVSDWLGTAAAA